jgi:tryptophan 2,3-dioxygenase
VADGAPKNTYSTYLQIDRLLSAQTLQTDSDDELLFIVIHQSHELWFKLAIHELDCAIRALTPDPASEAPPNASECVSAYMHLARVSQIQELLIMSWSVLRTLTPDEFHVFRDTVGRDGASGFQSVQYRILEFKLGLKYDAMEIEILANGQATKHKMSVFDNVTADERRRLRAALDGPSIYDATIAFTARLGKGYDIHEPPGGDYSARHVKQKGVFEFWKRIYENRNADPELYQLGEKLIDLEDAFRRWRFNHLATVSRIIGSNAGTGGSTGLRYLKGIANQLFEDPMYPELWDVRNYMFNRGKFDLAAAGYGGD